MCNRVHYYAKYFVDQVRFEEVKFLLLTKLICVVVKGVTLDSMGYFNVLNSIFDTEKTRAPRLLLFKIGPDL